MALPNLSRLSSHAEKPTGYVLEISGPLRDHESDKGANLLIPGRMYDTLLDNLHHEVEANGVTMILGMSDERRNGEPAVAALVVAVGSHVLKDEADQAEPVVNALARRANWLHRAVQHGITNQQDAKKDNTALPLENLLNIINPKHDELDDIGAFLAGRDRRVVVYVDTEKKAQGNGPFVYFGAYRKTGETLELDHAFNGRSSAKREDKKYEGFSENVDALAAIASAFGAPTLVQRSMHERWGELP